MSYTGSVRNKVLMPLAIGLGVFAVGPFVLANDIFESVEFSNNQASPTVISPMLQLGTNTIHGSVNASQWGLDHDYFRIILPDSSRLSGVKISVMSYNGAPASAGFFDVLHPSQQNSGGATLSGNGSQNVAFTIGTPTNIVMHVVAPFVFELGTTASFNYEVELIVSQIEVVGGAQICTAVEFMFPTESGVYYQVQCASDLAADNWINLGPPVLGNGAMLSAFDTTRIANQRFYRAIKQ